MLDDQSLKVSEFLQYLSPGLVVGGELAPCPPWPGDVFAIAAALLEKSGAYPILGTRIWQKVDHRQYCSLIRNSARRWRRGWGKASTARIVPADIRRRWQAISSALGDELHELAANLKVCRSLFELVAISDECLAGAGIKLTTDDSGEVDRAELRFWFQVDLFVKTSFWDHGSTLCDTIHPSRVRVLPKSQTPRSGLSLRSLTHHVALCPPVNIKAMWYQNVCDPEVVGQGYCNLLIVPWPFEVLPSQFSAKSPGESVGNPPGVNWFEYEPQHSLVSGAKKSAEILETVEALLAKAKREVGEVHLVVLPELALTIEQWRVLRHYLNEKQIGLIAGVTEPANADQDSNGWSQNRVCAAFPSGDDLEDKGYLSFEQPKHHRWRLDENQITRYGLAGNLDPEVDWWEAIEVHKREINFFRLRSWLTTCVLVCEDLARIDPVGRFVRAVGPDLVIALLMDGPQLRDRWPAYHATVLADDPGSSVLTLTSLGMATLSQPRDKIGKDSCRVISMWRDPITGLTEIALTKDAKAAVLTLYEKNTPEACADGRDHHLNIGAPVLGGVRLL